MPKWILPIAISLLLTACHKDEEEGAAAPVVVTVKTSKAESATLQLAVTAPATIFPLQKAEISARVVAPIRTLNAKKGDEVSANQLLAILDGKDLGSFVQTWDLLQHQQAELKKNLAKAESDVESFNDAKTLTEAERTRSLERARGQVESIRTQHIPQNEAQIRFVEIRSPFRGTITEQFQYPGDLAKPEIPIFTVMDLTVVTGRAQVPESVVGKIRAGMPCKYRSVDGLGPPAAGRVTMINKAVDPLRRSVEVWCQISNSGYKLRPGTFGEVKFVTGESVGVMVPEPAVQVTAGTRDGFVMVVDASNTTHRRAVEVGEMQDGKAQILRGLKAGEVVVSEGGYGLPDNVSVTRSEATTEKKEADGKSDGAGK